MAIVDAVRAIPEDDRASVAGLTREMSSRRIPTRNRVLELLQQVIVLRVGADPVPVICVAVPQCQRPAIQGHSRRIHSGGSRYHFEMQTRMLRVVQP